MAKAKKTEIGGESPTNGARNLIELSKPYSVYSRIQGICPFLFHKWNCEAVAEKANLPKGSELKKIDDLETFVYRDENENLSIPGEYFRQSIINAAKFKQDPRSKRKSAMELYEAGVIVQSFMCSLETKDWDYEDQRRVVIMMSSITRTRPAMKKGWEVDVEFIINLPQYISPDDFHETLSAAGQFIGVGDFRPTFGRFIVTSFEV